MTEKRKLEKAIELLQESAAIYDKADRLLKDIGVSTIGSNRPIEFYLCNPRKKMLFIHSGVEKIADIIDSPVIKKGHPYFNEPADDRYISINIDGIEIYELRD
jgi:hypothetical protein